MPRHGWLWENFKKIAELRRRLICLGKPITRTDTFESMRILIATDHFHRIEAELLLHLEDSGYRLIVSKIGPCSQVIQTPKEVTIEEVPGFEDM